MCSAANVNALKVPPHKASSAARHFAARIGITTGESSTAGKTRLGKITRAGDERLRSVLVAGATAVIKQAKLGHGRPSPWLVALLKRKPPKLAAVALASGRIPSPLTRNGRGATRGPTCGPTPPRWARGGGRWWRTTGGPGGRCRSPPVRRTASSAGLPAAADPQQQDAAPVAVVLVLRPPLGGVAAPAGRQAGLHRS